MKRCIAGAALAFIVVSLCFAQAELPDAMKKSYIQLRPGVFDIGKITVEEVFRQNLYRNRIAGWQHHDYGYGRCIPKMVCIILKYSF